MGYVHDRDAIRDAAVRVAQEVGLAAVTYRLVGEALGIPARTVVYYFPTKSELIGGVLEAVERALRSAMEAALGGGPVDPPQAFASLWNSLATPAMDPVFRLYIELVGLAVARQSPYDELIPPIYHMWIDWLAERIDAPLEDRRAIAAATFAQVDGLLLVRHLGAADLASLTARHLSAQ